MKTRNVLKNIVIVGLLIIASACSGKVEHQTESKQIDIEDANSVQAVIDFRAGELNIQGALQENLLDAELTHNSRKDPPQVQYAVTDGFGELFLGVPDLGGMGASFGSSENIWALTFNQDIPLDFILEASDSNTTLNLVDVSLSQMRLHQNGREMTLDLSGVYPDLSAIEIGANAGTATFNLTGEYAALETILSTINASIQNFDLRGQWMHDLHVTIEGGTHNSVSLDLPEDVDVQVQVTSDKVDVIAEEFSASGGTYTNSTFGETDVTIYITIAFSSGDVTITR
ncbi:MAG: hypothetical protein GY847_15860 [Proteobacteria bacterium]|nr:hypothetical protein [Pseudomonadota bacterium]